MDSNGNRHRNPRAGSTQSYLDASIVGIYLETNLRGCEYQDFQCFFFKFCSSLVLLFFITKIIVEEGSKSTCCGTSKYSCRSGRISIDLEMTFKIWFRSGWGFPRQYLPTFQTPITMPLGGTVKLVVSTKERRWRVSAILSVRKKKNWRGLADFVYEHLFLPRP